MRTCAWCHHRRGESQEACILCGMPVSMQPPASIPPYSAPPKPTVLDRLPDAQVGGFRLREPRVFAVVAGVVLLVLIVMFNLIGGALRGAPGSTVAASSTPSATATAWYPAGASPCSDTLAVSAGLSCDFGAKVAEAYAAAPKDGVATVTLLDVPDPVRGASFTVVCTVGDPVTCPMSGQDTIVLR